MSDRPQRADGQTEEIDALPVPHETEAAASGLGAGGLPQVSAPRPVAPAARQLAEIRSAPVLQAAAVAAGGFVAGAAVVGLTRRRHGGITLSTGRARRPRGRRRSRRGGRRRQELTQVVASRSFLVDVHLLGPAGRGR